MNILFFLVPIALILAGVAVYGFIWAVRSGQYDDVDTPALRIMMDNEDDER
jgi:cbb3-type cytochrome oxidase maturation protein